MISDYVPAMDLGRGYDPQSGRVHKSSAINFSTKDNVTSGGISATYSLIFEEEQEACRQRLGIDLAARVRGLLWGASAKVSLYQEQSISSYSVRLILRMLVQKNVKHIANEELKPDLKQLWVDHADHFINSYGTEFIGSVIMGGEYIATVEIKTNCIADQQSLRLALGGGTQVYSGSLEMQKHVESISAGRTLSIHGQHSGGADADAKLELTVSEVMERLRGFEAEIMNSATAEYPIGFISYPYTDLGLPPLPNAVIAHRQNLLSGLANDYENARRLQADIAYILSYGDQFAGAETDILENLKSQAASLKDDIIFNAALVYGAKLKEIPNIRKKFKPTPSVSSIKKNFPKRITEYQKKIEVLARNPDWTDTGMFVFGGQKIVFDAPGIWSYASGKQCNAWGASKEGDPPNAAMPLPGQNFGALVCRIGNQQFVVGTQKEIRAAEAGIIYLVCNDSRIGTGWDDNAGSLTVDIKVAG